MLRISSAQIEALEAKQRRNCARHIGSWLATHHPKAVAGLSDAELELRARSGVWLARRYGLESFLDIRQFVTLMFLIAPDFDLHPSIKAALTDPLVRPDERVAVLLGRITADEWEEARAGTSLAGWASLVQHV
jgi:hypothetical protein